MSGPTALDAFYLPAWLAVGMETTVQRFGPPHDSMDLRLPVVSPNDLQRWIEALRQARSERLVKRTTASILRSLDRVTIRFLDPHDPARRAAVAALDRAGRFSTPMIERALDDAFAPLARGGLRKWLTTELGSASVLDRPANVSGAMRLAHGPEWMLHIYAGNVPTVPIWPLFYAPLLKSALLAKTSSQEPILAPLVARTIAEVDPEIGECLAVVWWKGGASELDRAALSDAPAVLAFGGDVAMASVARQARPGAALVLHGPKLSIGYIGRHALTRSGLSKLTARGARRGPLRPAGMPLAARVLRGAPRGRVAGRLCGRARRRPRIVRGYAPAAGADGDRGGGDPDGARAGPLQRGRRGRAGVSRRGLRLARRHALDGRLRERRPLRARARAPFRARPRDRIAGGVRAGHSTRRPLRGDAGARGGGAAPGVTCGQVRRDRVAADRGGRRAPAAVAPLDARGRAAVAAVRDVDDGGAGERDGV